MADLPFWFHPDATAEVLAIHDHYFGVAANLAEDFHKSDDASMEYLTFAIMTAVLRWL